MKSLKLKSVLAKAVRRYFAKSDLFTNDLMTLGSVWTTGVRRMHNASKVVPPLAMGSLRIMASAIA